MRNYLLLLLLSTSAVSFADDHVSFEAWARATAPGATTGAVYGRLENRSPDTLVLTSVSFEQAAHVMVHRTVEQNGMMRMKHADISLAPGESVILAPGGLHMMLMQLAEPLTEGCRYMVTLKWQSDLTTTHAVATGGYGQSEMPEKTAQSCR